MFDVMKSPHLIPGTFFQYFLTTRNQNIRIDRVIYHLRCRCRKRQMTKKNGRVNKIFTVIRSSRMLKRENLGIEMII